jgi:lactoylglutathione lyase
MFQQIDYVMIIVSDMNLSVRFYRDLLSIPLKFESPEWTEFVTGATTLALHSGGVKRPVASEELKNVAGSCSIGFNVSNVDQTYEELKSKGVVFLMPPSEREGESIRLAVALDPDGLPISFAQSVK